MPRHESQCQKRRSYLKQMKYLHHAKIPKNLEQPSHISEQQALQNT